jgi:catechol 2,3-dioxygenase-like lactoylglutathione lyase family enzyme
MPPTVYYSTPLLHVRSIEDSVRFYQLLSFRVIDTDGCEPLGWARLHHEGGALMFLRAEEPVDPTRQGVALYMYSPDLAGLCEHLKTNGVKVPPVSHPPYMKGGEVLLRDPDGYAIFVGHWGEAEQKEWEAQLAARKARQGAD